MACNHPRAPGAAACQTPLAGPKPGREVPQWSAERRASRSQGTQRRLAGSGVSTCFAKARPGASKDRSTPASLGAPLPLARPQVGKEEGKRTKRRRRGRRRKTNGRRSYVLFDNLVGSARLFGKSGETLFLAPLTRPTKPAIRVGRVSAALRNSFAPGTSSGGA